MKISISLLAMLCLSFCLIGQSVDSISIQDLEVPSSPGFILLDEAPSSIENPTSAKSLILSVVKGNYAAEFSPFWWLKDENMTTLKYLGLDPKNEDSQNIFHQIKTSSVSAAFVEKMDTSTSMINNNLAMGIRSNIITVRSKRQRDEIHEKYNSIQIITKTLVDLIKKIPLDDPDRIGKIQKIIDGYEKEEDKKDGEKNSLEALLKEKPIFGVSAAFAYNQVFEDAMFSKSRFGKLGLWLTANTAIKLKKDKNDYLNVYILTRVIDDKNTLMNNIYENKTFWDIGSKVELEFSKLKFSYEYISRQNENFNTYRSNGLLEYRIHDNFKLTGAFGKNFGEQDNLISLLGINWGFQTANTTKVSQ